MTIDYDEPDEEGCRVKRRDLERHLVAHGARKVGEGTTHSKRRSADGGRGTAVARHTEIGPGLVRAICAQLGIPRP